MTTPPMITVPTDLLAAIAKWASDDDTDSYSLVVFRDGEIVAMDGARFVRVPFSLCLEVSGELRFAVGRKALLAAIAAQNVIERDGIAPPIEHDLVAGPDGDTELTDGPYGNRVITLRPEGERVVLDIGGCQLLARLESPDKGYPKTAQLDQRTPKPSGESPPDGIILQPRFLVNVEEIATAAWCRTSGVRCSAWSGHEAPMLLETKNGVRMVLMPMRQSGFVDKEAP